MIDTRIIEKKAAELANQNQVMTFRLLLPNGNMIQRKITPVIPRGDGFIIYRDHKDVYKGINQPISDIQNVDLRTLWKIESTEMPAYSSENGTIKHCIENLLKMNFELIDL
jgi:hypothetical protein